MYKKRSLIHGVIPQEIENFTLSASGDANTEVDKLVSKYNKFNNIQGIKEKFTNMPLQEYCIKASYNTACSGNYVSVRMIEEVLKRGCRFLDFEVFYIQEGNLYIPKVAVSSDTNFAVIDTKNSIKLDEVLSTVATNSFSQTSPNNTDPVFVNLRIKSRDSNVYQAVAKSIDANLKTIAYAGRITESTKLADIMKKVVIIVDKTINPGYKSYADCKSGSTSCFSINNYANVESGSEYLNLYHYTDLLNHANTPVLLKDDNVRTTAENMKMAIPDKIINKANPAFKEFVIKHGCQTVLYQFQIMDKNLVNYEEFFNDTMGGIIPLSVALPYFVRK